MTITSLLILLLLGISIAEKNVQLTCFGKSENILFITKNKDKKTLNFKFFGKKVSINFTKTYNSLKKMLFHLKKTFKILDLSHFYKDKIIPKIRTFLFLMKLKA